MRKSAIHFKKPEIKGAGFDSEGKLMLVFSCAHLCVTNEFRPNAIPGLIYNSVAIRHSCCQKPGPKPRAALSVLSPLFAFQSCHWSRCVALIGHELVNKTNMLQVVLFFSDIGGH